MLDYRYETFLVLYKTGSYTKAALELHITQPAVTQHIQFLENYYKCKLFKYQNKSLQPTLQADELFYYASSMRADSEKIRINLGEIADKSLPLVFGATLTIGEYLMPNVISKLILENESLDITMQVENTKTLLERLIAGQVDFVLLEGFFNAEDYAGKLLCEAEFIPVCSANSPFASGTYALDELLCQRLITREKGSGTREVLEQMLNENNLSVNSFRNICEIGNIGAIKNLVQQNLGIAFLYSAACKQELSCKSLVQIDLGDIKTKRGFNFVHLKNSLHSTEYEQWFVKIQECIK